MYEWMNKMSNEWMNIMDYMKINRAIVWIEWMIDWLNRILRTSICATCKQRECTYDKCARMQAKREGNIARYACDWIEKIWSMKKGMIEMHKVHFGCIFHVTHTNTRGGQLNRDAPMVWCARIRLWKIRRMGKEKGLKKCISAASYMVRTQTRGVCDWRDDPNDWCTCIRMH